MTREPSERTSSTRTGSTPAGGDQSSGVPPGALVPSGATGPWMHACPGCGSPIPAHAIACVWCSPAFCNPRSKRRAVLYAVFLSICTWLYTYKRDRKKFWVGLIVGIAGLYVPFVHLGEMALCALWCWAIIDTAMKPSEWYRGYPGRS